MTHDLAVRLENYCLSYFPRLILSHFSRLIQFLSAPYEATEPKNADIIWTSVQVDEEMKKAVGLNDQQFINQFPFEACIVMKHHLAETVQKVLQFLTYDLFNV